MSAIGLSGYLVSADQFMERFPFLSTLSSITKIFIRTVCCCCSQATLNKNRYISYVNSQGPLRIVLLLIPFLGNFLVWIFDAKQISNQPAPLQSVAVERPPLLQQPVVREMSVEDIYQEARTSAKRGKSAKAFALYQHAADRGFAFADFHLAECYEKGEGTEKNLSLAKTYYERAAEKGHVESAVILALRECDSDHMEEVWKWLGRVQQHALVKILVEGEDWQKDDKEKVRWMIESIIQTQALNRAMMETAGIDCQCPHSLVP